MLVITLLTLEKLYPRIKLFYSIYLKIIRCIRIAFLSLDDHLKIIDKLTVYLISNVSIFKTNNNNNKRILYVFKLHISSSPIYNLINIIILGMNYGIK